jgi:hypothetical protein
MQVVGLKASIRLAPYSAERIARLPQFTSSRRTTRPATMTAMNPASTFPSPEILPSLAWFLAVHALAIAALIACGLHMNEGSAAPTATRHGFVLELRPSQL